MAPRVPSADPQHKDETVAAGRIAQGDGPRTGRLELWRERRKASRRTRRSEAIAERKYRNDERQRQWERRYKRREKNLELRLRRRRGVDVPGVNGSAAGIFGNRYVVNNILLAVWGSSLALGALAYVVAVCLERGALTVVLGAGSATSILISSGLSVLLYRSNKKAQKVRKGPFSSTLSDPRVENEEALRNE